MSSSVRPRHSAEILRPIAVLVAGVLAACQPTAQTDGDIVFGLAAPITRSYGESSVRGAELAVKQINDAGGVNGRSIRLEVRDDDADPQQAIQVATDFYDDPRVIGVVGHVTSGPMLAAAPIYSRGLAAIGTTTTSPRLTGLSPWIFRVGSSDSANVVMMAREARQLSSTVAVMYANEPYGQGLARVFRDALRREGVEVIESNPYLEEMNDFVPYLKRLQRKGVDLVLLAGVEEGAATLIRQSHSIGYFPRFMGGDGLEALVDMGAEYNETLVGMLFHPDANPSAKAFSQAYRAAYKMEPNSSAAAAYDAVWLLHNAITAGGPTREQVRENLARVGRPNGIAPLEGAAGLVRYDERNDPQEKPFVIGVIRNGRYELFAQGS